MLEIFIYNKKNRLLKLAYSKNDHTIPNNICINNINMQNQANTLLWQMTPTESINDTGDAIQNIKQFNFNLQYEFDSDLGNIGLLCLTGKKNNIIAKFEFYVQKLTQNSINNAINKVKQFCKQNNFLKHKFEFQLKQLQKYLNSRMYKAFVLIHNIKKPYKALNSSLNNYQKNYSKNTQFTNELIIQYIKEIMQQENFILI